MFKVIIACATLAVLLLSQDSAQGTTHGSFTHPGTLHSSAELEFIKSRIQDQDIQWTDFNTQANAAYAAPLPQPVAEFYCGRALKGQRRDPACSAMRSDGQRAYTLALQWYFTGDERYGIRSLDIIRLWQNEFCAIRGDLIEPAPGNGKCKGGTYVDDRGQSALEASWIAPHFVNAAEILRHADIQNSLWTVADTVKFENFLGKLLNEMEESRDGASYSNAVWSEIEARMAIAIFQDDKKSFNSAVELWHERIKASIYLRKDGLRPNHVPNRTGRALVHDWNFPIGFYSGEMPSGLQAETCRDLNHADMAFRTQIFSAHMAYNQGVDLFDTYQERIRTFMEFHNGMRNGAVDTGICKNASLFQKARSVLATAERIRKNQNNGSRFANKIKAKRSSLKWNKPDILVRPGRPGTFRSALSKLGGTGNQAAWLGLLTQSTYEGDFDRHLTNLSTIADIRFWQEWPNRSPNCYGGKNSSKAYPCGRYGDDIDLWYLAYNHVSHRLGLSLPMTKITIENYEANGLLVPSQQFIGLSKWESFGGVDSGLFSPSYNSGSYINNNNNGLFNSKLYPPDNTMPQGQDLPDSVSVNGNTISWPDDGWYQVQTQDDYREVCAAGRSCQVPSGIYKVINHTTGKTFENIRVD
ncbi:MAG: alginate lyase family protein [Granulosicoccus sp.]